MKVFVSVKQAGKRKEYITKKELALKKGPASLRELIKDIIGENVVEYNKKTVEPLIVRFLTFDEIEDQVQTGKIGFGERINQQRADADKAIETAMEAFTDGLYRVFIKDQEITTLDEPLAIKDGDVLTFIRFTMLAGRMW